MQHRISLITVCRNAERTIAAALTSARLQTVPPFEHFIIDGNSGDRTLDVVGQFSDLPLRISSQPDQGIYDAMNRGITQARGDILFFLNADDRLYDAQALAHVAQAFDDDPTLDLVWGNVGYGIEHGRACTLRYPHIDPDSLLSATLCHQAVFAHRRLFERFGNFDLKYPLCADYDWQLRVLRGGARYRYLDVGVAHFSPGGASEQAMGQLYREKARIRRKHLAWLPWMAVELRLFLRRSRYRFNAWRYSLSA